MNHGLPSINIGSFEKEKEERNRGDEEISLTSSTLLKV